MLKIAHRGASAYEPENTLSAFQKAIDLNVDMIELDVHKTKDNKIIVIHDSTLDRVTNGSGKINQLTMQDISKFNIRRQKVPTLQDVLDLVNKKVKINIEIKCCGIVDLLADVIKSYVENKDWSYTHFLVSSFDHHEVKKFKELLSKVPVGAIIEGKPISYSQFAKDADADYAILYYENIDQKFIDDAHSKGLKVLSYTVDNVDDIEKLKSLGVDGIISNYPDRL